MRAGAARGRRCTSARDKLSRDGALSIEIEADPAQRRCNTPVADMRGERRSYEVTSPFITGFIEIILKYLEYYLDLFAEKWPLIGVSPITQLGVVMAAG
jgi:hypothetical protein